MTEIESRRAQATAQIAGETGIDERMIEALVHRFYDHVRADPLLGPVFGGMLQKAAGGAATMDLVHYRSAFTPMLWGVAGAVVLALLLRETGPAARRPSANAAQET